MRMGCTVLLAFVALASTAVLGPARGAAPQTQDPDWPCQQRLVAELSWGAYWNSPSPPSPDANWHSDLRVEKLVDTVTPRDVSPEEGSAKIDAFVKSLKPSERDMVSSAAFVGILAETNRERTEIIERIKELGRRQRGIADQVSRLSDQIGAIPPDTKPDDAQRIADATNQRNLLTRTFDETRHTMRYACDVPTQLEARLGIYARALQK
jgi:hypothetical protein